MPTIDLYLKQGIEYQSQQCYQEASWQFQLAQQLSPRNFWPYWHLGQVFQSQGCYPEAYGYYLQALPLAVDPIPVYEALATVSQLRGQPEQALDYLQQILIREPHHCCARLRHALVLPVIYPHIEAIAHWRQRFTQALQQVAQQPVTSEAITAGSAHFWLSYQGEQDCALLSTLAQVYLKVCPQLAFAAPHCLKKRYPHPRIRLGMVSAHWYEHTISRLFSGLLAHLPWDTFEVWGIAASVYQDHVTTQLAQSCEHWLVLSSQLEPAREQISALALDVLFYPDIGMEPLTYFLAFSRLAPVQVTSWGHPQTTGIPTIDYFLSSQALETDGAEAAYSETLVRMPSLLPYYPRPELAANPKPRRAFGLPEQAHLYLCPQSLFKIHPQFDSWIDRILQQDPQGYVVLVRDKPDWVTLLHQRLTKIIPTEKIMWLPRISPADYRQLAAVVDVILDPPYLSGGHSSYELFASGTPIVTWPSPWLKGRLTAALYCQMGVMDCVAIDGDAYVRLALRLGTEPLYQAQIKQKIQDHLDQIYACQGAIDGFSEWVQRVVKARF